MDSCLSSHEEEEKSRREGVFSPTGNPLSLNNAYLCGKGNPAVAKFTILFN